MIAQSGHMSSGEAERELWRQTRKYINEYEDRAAELQLDFRRERSALESAANRQKQTQQEASKQKQHTETVGQKCNEQHIQLLDLRKQSQIASLEAARLNQQLQLLQKDVQGKVQIQKQSRDTYAAHLKEQKSVLEEYTAYCNAVSD
ncbi:hypothetical protein WJX79_007113 [Trebouxia sp. C0005]